MGDNQETADTIAKNIKKAQERVKSSADAPQANENNISDTDTEIAPLRSVSEDTSSSSSDEQDKRAGTETDRTRDGKPKTKDVQAKSAKSDENPRSKATDNDRKGAMKYQWQWKDDNGKWQMAKKEYGN